MANSVDPDEMAYYEIPDLDLNCLNRIELNIGIARMELLLPIPRKYLENSP